MKMKLHDYEVSRRAAQLFADECKANGAMMQGGFGFLSEEAKQPYLDRAEEQMAEEDEKEQERSDNSQFGVGA